MGIEKEDMGEIVENEDDVRTKSSPEDVTCRVFARSNEERVKTQRISKFDVEQVKVISMVIQLCNM